MIRGIRNQSSALPRQGNTPRCTCGTTAAASTRPDSADPSPQDNTPPLKNGTTTAAAGSSGQEDGDSHHPPLPILRHPQLPAPRLDSRILQQTETPSQWWESSFHTADEPMLECALLYPCLQIKRYGHSSPCQKRLPASNPPEVIETRDSTSDAIWHWLRPMTNMNTSRCLFAKTLPSSRTILSVCDTRLATPPWERSHWFDTTDRMERRDDSLVDISQSHTSMA